MRSDIILPSGGCGSCSQKDALIKKYQNLIHLYKKKQAKLSIDASSRLSSNDNHGQFSKIGPRYSPPATLSLVTVMQNVIRSRYMKIFAIYRHSAAKKLSTLVLCKSMQKSSLFSAFSKVKHSESKGDQDSTKTGEGISSIEKKKIEQDKSTEQLNQDIRSQIIDQQQLISPKVLFQAFQSRLEQIREDITCNERGKTVRQLIRLKIENRKNDLQISILTQSLKQLVRRQEREYEKKKNSLEELGEELKQKDQRIHELEVALKTAQAKIQSLHPDKLANYILEDDPIVMRKQLDRLQDIIEKLNIETARLRVNQNSLQFTLKQAYKKQLQLIKQNKQLNEDKLRGQCSIKQSEILQQEMRSLVESMKLKVKRLSVHQKKLTEKEVIKIGEGQQIIEQLKSQMILCFLANIDQPMYQLKVKSLFDGDEISALNQFKKKYLGLVEKSQSKFNLVIDGGGIGNKKEQFGGHQEQRERDLSDIFSIIEEKNHNNQKQSDSQEQDRDRTSKQGITMRLIEMQLDKARQVEKISELKQKFMHIRILILNLLKSLQIRENSISRECKATIQVLIGMFEYSEEERESMFVKKKLFGFI